LQGDLVTEGEFRKSAVKVSPGRDVRRTHLTSCQWGITIHTLTRPKTSHQQSVAFFVAKFNIVSTTDFPTIRQHLSIRVRKYVWRDEKTTIIWVVGSSNRTCLVSGIWNVRREGSPGLCSEGLTSRISPLTRLESCHQSVAFLLSDES
jgi:hypothetical protein